MLRRTTTGGSRNKLAPAGGIEAVVLNVVAAGVATTVSGPFNYVRNIKYSFPADRAPPSTAVILRDLVHVVGGWVGLIDLVLWGEA